MSKSFVGVVVLVLLATVLAACGGEAAPTAPLSADKEYTTTTSNPWMAQWTRKRL